MHFLDLILTFFFENVGVALSWVELGSVELQCRR